MKISCNWLREFVDFKTSPETLVERLASLGFGVEELHSTDGDVIIELEITPNRGDCLCILGIAREISAALSLPLKDRKVEIKGSGDSIKNFAKVKVEDFKLCRRYTARMITELKIGPSPSWLKKRIEAMGVRSVNNVVDATNYVLLERGQPLHAFDWRLIKGGTIIVRRAGKAESIITLDGVERKLTDEMLVIADTERPIAIAGIMGGLNTEVTDKTTDVLIESAYFDPVSIRRTSMALGLETLASYRFQRNADIEEVRVSLDRAAELISRLAGGRIIKGVIDEHFPFPRPKKIKVSLERVYKLLGMKVSKEKIINILKNLGFGVNVYRASLTAVVPSFRYADVKNEEDVIEEIARLNGYDKIPQRIPVLKFVHDKLSARNSSYFITRTVKEGLADIGFNEVLNSGIIRGSILKNLLGEINAIKVSNPMDEEQNVLRPSLIPGLIQNLIFNFNRDITDLKLFEVGRIFLPVEEGNLSSESEILPEEQIMLCMAMSGNAEQRWDGGTRMLDFYDLKGVIEYLFERLRIPHLEIKPSPLSLFEKGTGTEIFSADTKVGIAGELKRGIARFFKIPQDVYLAELNLEKLLSFSVREKKYRPIPRYPGVRRDISLIVPVEINEGDVRNLILKEGGGFIENLELFDFYQGEQVPQGHKALGYRLSYQSAEKTLTSAEVDKIHSCIIKTLSSRGIRLREKE